MEVFITLADFDISWGVWARVSEEKKKKYIFQATCMELDKHWNKSTHSMIHSMRPARNSY